MKEALLEQLIRHEGLKLKPYYDTVGKLTIGIGRNLDDYGITKEEALYLCKNNILQCIAELESSLPFFSTLDEVRQDVLVNMTFNLGIFGLLKFKNTLSSIERGDYNSASMAMLDSKWAKQVGNRAVELAEQMKTGIRKGVK
jgi:lysozyme